MALKGSDQEKLEELCKKTHQEQGIWMLNAFWDSCGQANAEKVWDYVRKYEELDRLSGKNNNSALDELNAHRFLESFHEANTVKELRDKLRQKGAFKENVIAKMVPITHFLAIKFDIDWHTLVNAPQGNPKEVEEAQRRLQVAQEAMTEAENKEKESRAAAREAKSREAAALKAEQEAKEREAKAVEADETARKQELESKARAQDLRAAQEEVEAAFLVVKAEEDAYNAKTEDLKQKSETGGAVSRNKAKNELAQHLASDNLPLKKAKITQEAALKRAEKAAAAAEEAARKAEAAAREAEKKRQEATQARQEAVAAAAEAVAARKKAEAAAEAAEAAAEEARARFAEAEAYFEEVKSRIGYGAQWWVSRQMHEAKKYLPLAKGGIAK